MRPDEVESTSSKREDIEGLRSSCPRWCFRLSHPFSFSVSTYPPVLAVRSVLCGLDPGRAADWTGLGPGRLIGPIKDVNGSSDRIYLNYIRFFQFRYFRDIFLDLNEKNYHIRIKNLKYKTNPNPKFKINI